MSVEDKVYHFKSLYQTSSPWFKRISGRLYSILPMSIRYGKTFKITLEFLNKSQWWSREQFENWQLEQLKKLIRHAYENVPYYKHTFDQNRITPEDIKTLEDFRKISFVTRENIKKNLNDFVAINYKNKIIPFTTGGSTGEPLKIYWEKGRTRPLEKAFMWRQWNWVNFNIGDKTAVLRGFLIKKSWWYYDPIDKALVLSAYHLKGENIPHYIQKLREFQPVSIQAYPSVLTILAKYMKNKNTSPINSIKVILCGSENLFPYQRKLFEEVFQCRVFSWYGQGENVCLAANCEFSNNYHIFSEYGFTELIDEEGNPVEEEDERGEIVSTGFNNYALPLIRYRTGDIGVMTKDQCNCRRCYSLLKRIDGRKQDYIVTSDGRLISATALIFGQHFDAFSRIERMQLVQVQKGDVTVKIVKYPDYARKDEEEIRAKMIDCVGSNLRINFSYVEQFHLTRRGKHIFVIQKLPIDSLWTSK